MRNKTLVSIIISVILSNTAIAAPEIADAKLRKAIHELSASTLQGGEGWETYERLLHPNYARWAMGEVYEGRDKFVRSLEEWWDYGMRVAEREMELIAVDIVDDIAIVRFKTTETFIGPDGPAGGFTGYVSSTWVKQDGVWLLLSADISSLERN